VYADFGFTGVRVALGTRPEKYMGDPGNWEKAERALAAAFEKRGRAFFVNAGDGAFYGPKLDFQVQDAIGRYWQLGTLQVDFSQPENFDLTYVGEDGGKHRPVVLHRAILGSVERFLGILIEHTAGAFPVWLAPVQAVVIPVSDRFADYARSVAARLSARGFRAETDDRNEKMGARIRHAELQKIPYMLIVGEREQASDSVSPRKRKAGDLGATTVDAFADVLAAEVARRQ
jgi:threonyl-tRNA synthetase